MSIKRKKRQRRWILLSVMIVAVVGIFITAFLRKKDDAISVQTGKVERRDITEVVVANGRVQPVLSVKISPEVSGEIIELPVKEGQQIHKGDLLLRIKPDFYVANRNSAEASYKSSLSDQVTANANLAKAEAELRRNKELFEGELISESVYMDIQTSYEIAKASLQSSKHRVEMASASLARSEEELAKTTIVSPIDGTVSQLNSKLGERVVGTAQMAGTDVMSIVDLNEMEARVDIGEMDIVLIDLGQKATLEVDAFRDRKFSGVVTEIGNAARNAGASGQSQDATRFEVKIHIAEKANFRPGMSVTADVETRYRKDVLSVPIASVTTRPPKPKQHNVSLDVSEKDSDDARPDSGNTEKQMTQKAATGETHVDKDSNKPVEVVFVVDGDKVRQQPVSLGISDNGYFEILDGLDEGEEIVIGGFLAISRELQDGKKIIQGGPASGPKIKIP